MSRGELLRAVARLSTATATGKIQSRDLEVIRIQLARAEKKVFDAVGAVTLPGAQAKYIED